MSDAAFSAAAARRLCLLLRAAAAERVRWPRLRLFGAPALFLAMLAFFAGAIVGMVERRNDFMEPKLLQDGSSQFQGLDSRGNPGDHLLQNLDPLGRFGDLPRIGAHYH